MEVLFLIIYLVSFGITIWVISLIYSINKSVKNISERIGKAEDPLLSLFKAKEAGDKESCKKILDECVRNDFYEITKKYILSPHMPADKEDLVTDKQFLAKRYSELYDFCGVEPLDFEHLGKLETYNYLLLHQKQE